MIYITIIFGVVALISTTLFIMQKNSIQKTIKNMKRIEKSITNEQLQINYPNRTMEELTIQINKLLEEKERDFINYKRRDDRLRKEISNVSHDLRTPLTSILGYIQLLKDKSLSQEERQEYLHIIENRSSSLQNLIKSFYELSRLEGGEYDFNLENVDLYLLLSDIIATYYNDFKEKNLHVELELQSNLPRVIADTSGVKRVFQNLTQNMLQHGENTAQIKLWIDNNKIYTSFTNYSRNIDEEDIPHLFDRFYIADKIRTGQNTGLGLAIVKKLLEGMGYKIYAKFLENEFTIIIEWSMYL